MTDRARRLDAARAPLPASCASSSCGACSSAWLPEYPQLLNTPDLLFATDTDLVGRRLAPAGSRFEPDLPFHGAASCTSKAKSVSRPAVAAQVLSTPRVVEGRDQVPRHAVIAARP